MTPYQILDSLATVLTHEDTASLLHWCVEHGQHGDPLHEAWARVDDPQIMLEFLTVFLCMETPLDAYRYEVFRSSGAVLDELRCALCLDGATIRNCRACCARIREAYPDMRLSEVVAKVTEAWR